MLVFFLQVHSLQSHQLFVTPSSAELKVLDESCIT